ncbi:hypothetical protein F6X40_09560 [Paraburkholderia sp. UCT31]|uniref:hypothetical protein n=1 Tax=Paraburkholderia sp. UCT31 TaxID=2615209 RepID=UPI0016551128|nr:hypothetical protein [Paraburkholderia sp. UCT31]MBC8737055.1 hypothetical protein [Paraburkholderia sp. UCT31]
MRFLDDPMALFPLVARKALDMLSSSSNRVLTSMLNRLVFVSILGLTLALPASAQFKPLDLSNVEVPEDVALVLSENFGAPPDLHQAGVRFAQASVAAARSALETHTYNAGLAHLQAEAQSCVLAKLQRLRPETTEADLSALTHALYAERALFDGMVAADELAKDQPNLVDYDESVACREAGVEDALPYGFRKIKRAGS